LANERPRWLAVSGVVTLLAVAVGVRAWLVPAVAGKLDGDNAVVGLMARHALDGELTAFFWGQHYMGSLEAWTSALVFGLAGDSVEALCLALLPYTIAFLVGIAWLADRWLGRPAAWTALAVGAVGSPLVLFFSVTPRGGYAAVLPLGVGVLVLAEIAAERRSPIAWALLGALAGLAFWTNWLVAPFFAVGLGILAVSRLRTLSAAGAVLGGAGFFLGSAPFWAHNLRNDFATFAFLEGRSGGRMDSLAWALRSGVPEMLGLVPFSGGALDRRGVAAAVLAVALGLVAAWRLGRARGAGSWPAVWIGALLALNVLVFATSASGKYHVARYLLPVAVPALLLVAAGAGWLARRSRAAAAALVAALAGALLVRNASARTHVLSLAPASERAAADAILEIASREGIRAGFAPYGLAMLVTYLSKERVVFLDYHRSRYPMSRIESFDDPALVAEGWGAGAESIGAALAAIGVDPTARAVGHWTLYWPIRAPGPGRHVLTLPAGTAIRASRGGSVDAMTDGDLVTRWSTGGAQQPGDWIEVRFPEPVEIAGVQLFLGGRRYAYPRQATVTVEAAGGEREVVRELAWGFPLAFYGPSLIVGDDDDVQILFDPRPVRGLRIELTAGHSIHDWTVAELVLYRPGGGRGVFPPAFWRPDLPLPLVRAARTAP
jgi:hypothetical protein